MTDTLATAIERVADDLRGHGVVPLPGWLDRITSAVEPHPLGSLSPDSPDQLIEAHFRFMDTQLDDMTTIIFSQAMADLFALNPPAMKPAFARQGKNQFMTRIVLGRRLASRYFHEGRRRADEEATIESGLWLLRRCVDLSVGIVGRDDRASPNVQRMMHSQIATASAHLARSTPRDDPAREGLLRSGLIHSLAAEESGDCTPDHDGYAIELALRLHELTGEDALTQVSHALSRTADAPSASLQGMVGDVDFARAAVALAARDTAAASEHLVSALYHYNRAISLPNHGKGADIGYHIAKRGRVHAALYEHGADASGRRDTIQLDRALSDWLDPRAEPHRLNHETARLLLARARLASARSDTAAARTDVERATALTTGLSVRPEPLQQLEAQSLGVAIENALDNADLDMVVDLLRSASALPPDAPVPAGSMAKAAIWLSGRLAEKEWKEAAEPVLDRIEIDIEHPALSASARGHVCGHAANLSRALYLTATPELSGSLRALELSRLHVATAQTPSASALDGASRAAAEYASQRALSAEAPSEDDLGVWVDALLWGAAALRTEQVVQTLAAPRFDIAGCAQRVAESAIRLLNSTGDRLFAVSAVDALEIAGTLTADQRITNARSDLAGALATAQRSSQHPEQARADIARPEPSPSVPERLLLAWHALHDADAQVGEVATQRRHEAARRFCELANAGDPSLGGQQRGGRRGVTILNDPYSIARQLVILKRVDRTTAQREFDAITKVAAWLSHAPETPGWTVPEPLGVIDVEGDDSVLVMRRLPGHTLAHHAMEYLDRRAPSPHHMFRCAALALANFHTAMWQEEPRSREDASETYRRAARQLTRRADADRSTSELAPVLDSGALLAKKDAHAGNWLWSAAAGGLVVIDIEGASARPALLELATLLDDLPLFDLDDEGWKKRLDIAKEYVERLPEHVRMGETELRHRTEAGALNVAVRGLARLNRRGWGSSSRGIRFAQYQQEHYRELIPHLARSADSESVRRAAAAMSG